MPAFETLGKVNRCTKSSLKRRLCCTRAALTAAQLHALSSVSLSAPHTSSAEASAQRLCVAQPALISAALRDRCVYLNFK